MNEMFPTEAHNLVASQKLENEPVVNISNASPEDVVGIRELEYKTWRATYPGDKSGITPEDIDWYFNTFKKSFSANSLEKIKQEIKDLPENQHVVVAKDADGKIVGYSWLMKNENENELGAIYVDPKFQGMNLGKKIWEEAEAFFGARNKTRLTVEENNARAIAFYNKLGFEDTGSRISNLLFPSGSKFEEIEMLKKAREAE